MSFQVVQNNTAICLNPDQYVCIASVRARGSDQRCGLSGSSIHPACRAGYFSIIYNNNEENGGSHALTPNILASCCPGFFCSESTTCMQRCTSGSSCLTDALNTTSEICQPSRRGTENGTCPGAKENEACPQGFYCSTPAVTPLACPQGYFCVAGTAVPERCTSFLHEISGSWDFCSEGTRVNLTKMESVVIGGMIILAFIFILSVRKYWLRISLHDLQNLTAKLTNTFTSFARGHTQSKSTQSAQEDDDDIVPVHGAFPSCDQPILEGLTFEDLRIWRDGNLVFTIDYHFPEPGQFFTLLPGITAVVGLSGAGKSTLLDVLAQRSTNYHTLRGCVALSRRSNSKRTQNRDGSITANSADNSGSLYLMDYISFCHRYGNRVAYVSQHSDVLTSPLTVWETVIFAARLRTNFTREECEKRSLFWLKTLQLAKRPSTLNQLTHSLSGGERKRVTVAAELVTDPLILYLDEPTSGLDTNTSEVLLHALHRFSRGHIVFEDDTIRPSSLSSNNHSSNSNRSRTRSTVNESIHTPRIVVMVVHQPSHEVSKHYFDRILGVKLSPSVALPSAFPAADSPSTIAMSHVIPGMTKKTVRIARLDLPMKTLKMPRESKFSHPVENLNDFLSTSRKSLTVLTSSSSSHAKERVNILDRYVLTFVVPGEDDDVGLSPKQLEMMSSHHELLTSSHSDPSSTAALKAVISSAQGVRGAVMCTSNNNIYAVEDADDDVAVIDVDDNDHVASYAHDVENQVSPNEVELLELPTQQHQATAHHLRMQRPEELVTSDEDCKHEQHEQYQQQQYQQQQQHSSSTPPEPRILHVFSPYDSGLGERRAVRSFLEKISNSPAPLFSLTRPQSLGSSMSAHPNAQQLQQQQQQQQFPPMILMPEHAFSPTSSYSQRGFDMFTNTQDGGSHSHSCSSSVRERLPQDDTETPGGRFSIEPFVATRDKHVQPHIPMFRRYPCYPICSADEILCTSTSSYNSSKWRIMIMYILSLIITFIRHIYLGYLRGVSIGLHRFLQVYVLNAILACLLGFALGFFHARMSLETDNLVRVASAAFLLPLSVSLVCVQTGLQLRHSNRKAYIHEAQRGVHGIAVYLGEGLMEMFWILTAPVYILLFFRPFSFCLADYRSYYVILTAVSFTASSLGHVLAAQSLWAEPAPVGIYLNLFFALLAGYIPTARDLQAIVGSPVHIVLALSYTSFAFQGLLMAEYSAVHMPIQDSARSYASDFIITGECERVTVPMWNTGEGAYYTFFSSPSGGRSVPIVPVYVRKKHLSTYRYSPSSYHALDNDHDIGYDGNDDVPADMILWGHSSGSFTRELASSSLSTNTATSAYQLSSSLSSSLSVSTSHRQLQGNGTATGAVTVLYCPLECDFSTCILPRALDCIAYGMVLRGIVILLLIGDVVGVKDRCLFQYRRLILSWTQFLRCIRSPLKATQHTTVDMAS